MKMLPCTPEITKCTASECVHMLLIAVGVSTSSRSSSYAVSEDFFKLGSKYGQGIRKRVAAGSIHRLDPVASGGFRFQWSVEVFLLRQKTTMHGVGTAKLVVVFRYMRSRWVRIHILKH